MRVLAGRTLANGQLSTNGNITLMASWPDPFLTWVISHELGHLLGLGHNDACAAGQTVMALPATCSSPAPVSVAQPSDGMPVARTVYGNAGTKTCGW